MGGTEAFEDTHGEVFVALYNSAGEYIDEFDLEANTNNEYSFEFPSTMQTGTYYVMALDENAEEDDACLAPAVMTVEVH